MTGKVYASLDAAVADIPDGAQIMFGGFGGAGFPNNLGSRAEGLESGASEFQR